LDRTVFVFVHRFGFQTVTRGYPGKVGRWCLVAARLVREKMGLADRVSSIVAFLRAGYPAGMPAVGYAPLLALLPRRVSDDEIRLIIRKLVPRRRPVDNVDVGVEITRVTNEMPSVDDIGRVQNRLTGQDLN
jgi:hypothetical protein